MEKIIFLYVFHTLKSKTPTCKGQGKHQHNLEAMPETEGAKLTYSFSFCVLIDFIPEMG